MDLLGHFFQLRIQLDVHVRDTSSQRLSNEASIVVGAPGASIQQDTDGLRADEHRARLCRLFSRRRFSAGVPGIPGIPGFLDRRFPLAGDRRVFELRKSRIAVDRRREVSHVAAGSHSDCQAQHQAGDRSGTGSQTGACHRRYSAASVGDIARLIAAGWLTRQEESVDGRWGQLSGRVKKRGGVETGL